MVSAETQQTSQLDQIFHLPQYLLPPYLFLAISPDEPAFSVPFDEGVRHDFYSGVRYHYCTGKKIPKTTIIISGRETEVTLVRFCQVTGNAITYQRGQYFVESPKGEKLYVCKKAKDWLISQGWVVCQFIFRE